ncbi:LysM peptidoglycan-binding domain-containing protein [Pistricoccus aurantiacus]|uniref:LysM peptidoglycan-binding domain-containing protein n=1 Tax=Pistricoccus aurantiacus TaxID=1883414 RepID=A0A5B8SSP5_9GAMM|nr:LysM domain-containing protein [Pistricoccus aurantiacus]QEA37810.1 LysM peptidoglycan-binding domain-containing protein [Pistricoccus aurantiacus]
MIEGIKRRALIRGGAALTSLLMALPSSAQSLVYAGLKENAPQRYTVVRGDTLWDISGRYLRHPWLWPELWQVNSQIDNPHLIYPGDTIVLEDCNGRPCLMLEKGREVVKLSPDIRRIPRREAVAPLPLEKVRHFLDEYRILGDDRTTGDFAYVVAGDDRQVISGAGDTVYARGNLTPRQAYAIYRPGERYVAAGGEVLGRELIQVATGRHQASQGDIATLTLDTSRQEVSSGDLVLPLVPVMRADEFELRAPSRPIDSQIIAVPGGVRFAGQRQVVTLDAGARSGLAAGQVLKVVQPGEMVSDPRSDEILQLPAVEAGFVMVFQVYDKLSYALVMQTSRPLSVGDRLRNPDANDLLVANP